jgi:hypothetical protein
MTLPLLPGIAAVGAAATLARELAALVSLTEHR